MTWQHWWKLYFFLALVLTVLTVITPLFVDDISTDLTWWRWSDVPLYIIQLVALFGLAFSRRVGFPKLWQLIFIATLIYEGWHMYEYASDWLSIPTDMLGLAISVVAITYLLQAPLWVGLYLYGFRCKDLWHGAT